VLLSLTLDIFFYGGAGSPPHQWPTQGQGAEPAEYTNARLKEKRRVGRRAAKTRVFSMCWQQEI